MQSPDSERLSRARRRQTKRQVRTPRSDQFEAILNEMEQKITPETNFYLFALLSGALVGLGFRFNQPVLLIAAVLLAPRMSPILGVAFAAVTGMVRLFLRMSLHLVILFALFGLAAGLCGSLGPHSGEAFSDLSMYVGLHLLNFFFVVIGAILFGYRLVQNHEIAQLPSAAIAYSLFLPLGAVVLTLLHFDRGQVFLAMFTFGLHLAWAIVAAMSVLIAKGFGAHSRTAGAYIATILLLSLIFILGMLSLGGSILVVAPQSTPAAPATIIPTPSSVPIVQPTTTATIVPSRTPAPTQTPLPSATYTPGPGIIIGTGGVGVMLREYPNGPSLGGLFDNTIVEVIGGPVQVEEDYWWKVRTSRGEEGWVLGNFLATATPETSPTP